MRTQPSVASGADDRLEATQADHAPGGSRTARPGEVTPFGTGARPLELSPRAQDALKLVALASMLVDHVGWVFFPGRLDILHWVGRLAFPLFTLLLAYNLERRAVPLGRYVLPLLVLALVSQAPYALALGSLAPGRLNIFFTLLLGVLAWRLARAGPVGPVLAAALVLASERLNVDYGPVGVALLPVAALLVRWPSPLALLAWTATALAANRFAPMAVVGALAPLLAAAVAGWLPGRRLLVGPLARLVGWWFYPLHLAALSLLARLA